MRSSERLDGVVRFTSGDAWPLARREAQQEQRTLPLAGIEPCGDGEQLAEQLCLLGRHFGLVVGTRELAQPAVER